MLANINNQQKGFTITEVLVAVVVASMVSVGILSAMIFFFADIIRADAEARLLVESQGILRQVVDDLRTGSNVLTTNTISDTNEPTGGWSTSNDDHILIVSQPAVDDDNDFIINDLTGGPYQNEFIYFTDGMELYKRILANPSASDNKAETTCPEGATSPSCRIDRLLSENFEDMTFVFYDQDNVVTSDPNAARSVDISIDMFRRIFGRDIEVENNIRVTLRNSNN
ncbi:MAG: prepilin-type N-terminal cleavage/methylation domain-containing protein [Candidatus Saccharimonadales bacterium]|nr:prepilin-type N-terminal cleavage/methylation domain-containing protein [Candidatus Saccharimonadales bacterium]